MITFESTITPTTFLSIATKWQQDRKNAIAGSIIKQWAQEKDRHAFYSRNEEGMLGFVLLHMTDMDPYSEHTNPWVLDYIYVVKNYRRKHIASTLVAKAKEGRGVTAIVNTKEGLLLLRKCGFSETSTLIKDCFLMRANGVPNALDHKGTHSFHVAQITRSVVDTFVKNCQVHACLSASLLIAEINRKCGNPELTLRVGFKIYEEERQCIQHVWIVDADNNVIDAGYDISRSLIQGSRGRTTLSPVDHGIPIVGSISTEMALYVEASNSWNQILLDSYWKNAPVSLKAIRSQLLDSFKLS
jgi:hypothetical protein